MTFTTEALTDHIDTTSTQANNRPIRILAAKVGRFVLHLLEMVLAMMVGMVFLYLLDVVLPPSPSYDAAFEYGTVPFDLAMAVFMTFPMVAWMRVRRHDSRHVTEMAFGMNAPVAAIVALRLLGAESTLPWLAEASHPAMFLGMIVAMLYRRDHFTEKAGHSAH